MEGDDAVTADNWKGFKNSTSYSIDDIKVDTIIQTSGDHDHQNIIMIGILIHIRIMRRLQRLMNLFLLLSVHGHVISLIHV